MSTARFAVGMLGLWLAAPALAQDEGEGQAEVEVEAEAELDVEDEALDRTPQECVSTTRLRTTSVLDDRTILFYARGNEVYRNTLQNRCPGLERAGRFSYRVRTSRLCSIDTITVLDQFGAGLSPGFTCRLGEFYPISVEEAEELELDLESGQAARESVEVEEVELEDEDESPSDGEDGADAESGQADSER